MVPVGEEEDHRDEPGRAQWYPSLLSHNEHGCYHIQWTNIFKKREKAFFDYDQITILKFIEKVPLSLLMLRNVPIPNSGFCFKANLSNLSRGGRSNQVIDVFLLLSRDLEEPWQEVAHTGGRGEAAFH